MMTNNFEKQKKLFIEKGIRDKIDIISLDNDIEYNIFLDIKDDRLVSTNVNNKTLVFDYTFNYDFDETDGFELATDEEIEQAKKQIEDKTITLYLTMPDNSKEKYFFVVNDIKEKLEEKSKDIKSDAKKTAKKAAEKGSDKLDEVADKLD